MSSYCRCKHPRPTREYPDSCHCGRRIEDWPAKIAEWFDRLEELGRCDKLRRHCEAREFAGRTTFGQVFLQRKNLEECLEELSDAALYLCLHDVQHHADDDEITRQQTAAYHIATAYRLLTE